MNLLYIMLGIFFIACEKTPENQAEDKKEFEQIELSNGFTLIIAENVSVTASDRAMLEGDLNEMTELLPASIAAELKTAIHIDRSNTNHYLPLSSSDELKGSIVLGNLSSYFSAVERNQPLLMMNLLSRYYFDQKLPDETKATVNAVYNEVKSKYTQNYYSNGVKFEITKMTPTAGTDVISYFSEITEAYLGENEFYPIDYIELKNYDIKGFDIMEDVWGAKTISPNKDGIGFPPPTLTQWLDHKESPLDLFYSKHIYVDNFSIVSSRFVHDEALVQAAYIVEHMFSLIPEAREELVKNNVRLGLVGVNENVTDLPEARLMNVWWPETNWDERGRGYGPTRAIPLVSCGEENIIDLNTSEFQERYWDRSIMVHEFAHAIDFALNEAYPDTWQRDLESLYNNALSNGLWVGSYSATNTAEYFAEGVTAWFDAAVVPNIQDRPNDPIKNREQLKAYDVDLYNLISKIMPAEKLSGYHFDE